MISKLFKTMLAVVVLGVVGLGIFLLQSGHVRAWYFSYELGEMGMDYQAARERADKVTTPTSAARDPEAAYGKVVRWDGQITDIRILQGKLKEIHLVDAKGTPFGCITDREIGELKKDDTARVYGLHKNLLYAVRIDGKVVPSVLAVAVERAPSRLDLLEQFIEIGEELTR